jgi:hypothetical protein
VLVIACAPALAADDVEITRALIYAADDGYRLDVAYRFELNHGLEDALQRNVRLSFKTTIELTRPRWYWTDEKPVSISRTDNIRYDALTRKYIVSARGSMHQTYDTIEETLFSIRRPNRWLIAARGELKPGETYHVTLRMFLDREELQKPLQVNALNDADWHFSSKKTFTYRAE